MFVSPRSFFFCLIFSRLSRAISRQWFSCSFQLWVCSCSEHSCTKCTQYDSFTSSKHKHMLSCRALGGMHLSALTGSQTAWRRMQEKRECFYFLHVAMHTSSMTTGVGGLLAAGHETLRLQHLLFWHLPWSLAFCSFFSLSSPLCQCTLSCQLLDGQCLSIGECV